MTKILFDTTAQGLQGSEQDLRDFFENGAMALHWVGADGTILKTNRAELEMLGYAEDEYVGRNIADFHADADVIADILARLRHGDVLRDYEARLRCKDGTTKDVLIDSSVLWRDGQFVHTRCFTRDVSANTRANEDASRLSAIVSSSADAIVSKDLNGIVISWNAAAERIFGYTAGEMIGKSIRQIIPSDRQSEEDDVLARIRRGDQVEHFETIRQRKDGNLIDISLTVSPVKDGRGRVIGASKIARDITERRLAEEAIRESMAIKDQFLSLVSHELRTPLATILGNGQLLLRRGDLLGEEDKQQALTDVVAEAERLQRIVENLLALSRMDARRQLHPEPILLPRLLQDIVAGHKRRNPLRQITLTVDEGVPIAQGEASLVTQVLENLIGNAMKYSPEDSEIEVRVTTDEAQLPRVTVLDHGIGFNAEEAAQLFTQFYRSKAAISTASGMGLGLAVSKRIVEAQGGTIGARRRDEGGAEFYFTLPPA